MKKVLSLVAVLFCTICSMAQNVDNFQVGPYTVDYYENGEVKCRLRNDIDLYKYFNLRKDTIINVVNNETILKHAVQISGFFEAGYLYTTPKGFGIETVWKQGIGQNKYFNAGLNLSIAQGTFYNGHKLKRSMLEVGIPLQMEWGKLSDKSASIYGNVGIMPAIYATMTAEQWCRNEQNGKYEVVDSDKKSGLLIAPIFEFGGNIPAGKGILRIGVTGKYKVNCGKKENGHDIYHSEVGRAFMGVKIGFVF